MSGMRLMHPIRPLSHKFGISMEEKKILVQLRAQKRDLLNEYHKHVCSREYCNPENIAHIYLCKFRQIHICLPDVCDLLVEGVCQLSGACYGPSGYSIYDHNDQQTWYDHMDYDVPMTKQRYLSLEGEMVEVAVVAVAAAVVPHKAISTKEIIKRIEGYIETLFYSSERSKMNAEQTRAHQQKANRAKEAYINKCIASRQLVNMMDLMGIEEQYKWMEAMIDVLPFDQNLLNHYTQLVLRMYHIIQQYSDEKICLESLTLGTLYYMRQGFSCDGVEVIPRDPFLVKNLPEMNDLRRFGFDKKKYTRGEKWITYTFECASKKKDDLKKIKLSGGEG